LVVLSVFFSTSSFFSSLQISCLFFFISSCYFIFFRIFPYHSSLGWLLFIHSFSRLISTMLAISNNIFLAKKKPSYSRNWFGIISTWTRNEQVGKEKNFGLYKYQQSIFHYTVLFVPIVLYITLFSESIVQKKRYRKNRTRKARFSTIKISCTNATVSLLKVFREQSNKIEKELVNFKWRKNFRMEKFENRKGE
jgi:hypothetical protein